MRALVTGATGFIGRGVLDSSRAHLGVEFRGAVRRDAASLPGDGVHVRVGDVVDGVGWGDAMTGIDVVIHTAARAHIMRDPAANPLEEFRRVNVAGTVNLARQAARSGVRRFVFLSSIKVNGDRTPLDQPFSATDAPKPVDAYGISKAEAEDALRLISHETGLEVVVIRPVLVYGPGVKGNFLSMMRWLRRGIPLPLAGIENRRSLVSLDNLVDLIHVTLHHPLAANQTFLVSDGVDLSTTDLLRHTAEALGTHARFLPMPAALVERAMRSIGKHDLADRLFGSLQVDISPTRELLDWTPPTTVSAGLARTARRFLDEATG